MPRALAVSPHLDDAVFSCGGTLARLARAGWEVTVCTAFTASVPTPTGFALACQLDKGLPPDADYMAIRRAEDAAACAILGARPLWLPLAEAPHRGYHNATALFGATHAQDRADRDLADLLVAGPLCQPWPDLLLAPQAIGGHVDHMQVTRALLHIAPDGRLPILWWTDFPYAARPIARAVQPFAARMEALPACQVAGDAITRRAACAAYTTQLDFQFGGMAGLDRVLAQAGPLETMRRGNPQALPADLTG